MPVSADVQTPACRTPRDFAGPGRLLARALAAILALGCEGSVHGESSAPGPSYADLAHGAVHGVVRIHGTELTQHLIHLWEDGFLKKQPLIRYSDYTVPAWFSGLCAGTADLAVTGHDAWRSDLKAFESVYGYDPLEILFATGGFDKRKGNTPGVIIFVNKDNPITGLTLEQLDFILGAQRTGGWRGTQWVTDCARGPEKNIRSWGQLGLTGEWADKPIALYGIDATLSGWSGLIQKVVFHGGDKWNPAIREFVRGGAETPADVQLVDGVAHDRYGLGFSFMRVVEANPGVRAVALDGGGGRIAPTEATFRDRSYPLVSGVYIYLNREPGKPIPPRLKEFLTYILSREGQQDIAADGMYLPLPPQVLAAERRKLE